MTTDEKSWKHRLLYSCFKCSCFVNWIFNILGKLGLDTRVKSIFTYKHLYPPLLLGVTQTLHRGTSHTLVLLEKAVWAHHVWVVVKVLKHVPLYMWSEGSRQPEIALMSQLLSSVFELKMHQLIIFKFLAFVKQVP